MGFKGIKQYNRIFITMGKYYGDLTLTLTLKPHGSIPTSSRNGGGDITTTATAAAYGSFTPGYSKIVGSD
jgi:hypothetical protein